MTIGEGTGGVFGRDGEVSSVPVLIVDVGGRLARLRVAAEPDLRTITVGSLSDGLKQAAAFKPRVVVLALSQPTAGEDECVRALCERAPAVLLVTQPSDEDRITRLLKAGANGCLDFAEAPARLFPAVRELMRGGIPMSPAAAAVVLRRARRSSTKMPAVRIDAAPNAILSERQREVLVLLARGHSYEHIALALDVSVNTVRTHLRVIYERLGASTKVEAVVIAQQMGLLGA